MFDGGEGEESHHQACRPDATKSPKEFDLGLPENPRVMAPGIYKIEGDQLTIMIGTQAVTGESPVERPNNFDHGAMAHYVFKRE